MSDFDPAMDQGRLEQPLTDKQTAVRDTFVGQYMKDFDAYRACIRMGFLSAFAIDMAKMFMSDGYTLRKIEHLTRSAQLDEEEDKQAMLANYRYLAFNASGAVRAAATAKYMEAKGYVQKDSSGVEAVADKLIAALSDFADKAPT